MIEPWRTMVDLIVFDTVGVDYNLSVKQRRCLTGVLHKPCKIDGKPIQRLRFMSGKTDLQEHLVGAKDLVTL